VQPPETRYAKSGDVHIAYQVIGEGPRDLVIVAGFASHVELFWELPALARFVTRLASFARVIVFDKRGTGLSDPVSEVPTLETRVDDVRAVMDAAGSNSAAVFGSSEGAPMALLFAATHPERVTNLVLFGAMARSTEAEDYDLALPAEVYREASSELMGPYWGRGYGVEVFAPSLAEDPASVKWWGRMERSAASPGMAAKLSEMFLDIDVRSVLPTIRVPTLVLHRHGDRVVDVRAGRWLAEHVPGARFVELPGLDHVPFAGDPDRVADEVEEFLTGSRPAAEPDRVLATLMFTDIVDSTKRAADLGDRRWLELLERHHDLVRGELERHRGREVKTTGDGFLATFDGPARAIRCSGAIRDHLRDHGVEVRAGLHTGEIEVIGEDVGGIAVHIAARVAAMAAGGETLVSSTVKDLVAGSGIEFEDRGAHELKGVPGEWHLYSVAKA
jgi:pimeloyl-ACP methyl ester carboxylesterase